MKKEDFKKLNPGDIIRHKRGGAESLIVTNNYGDRVTAVSTQDVSNPDEWDLISKHNFKLLPVDK